MKLKTHYLISKIAAEKENDLSYIQKKLFCLGSLLPDLSVTQFFYRHFYDASIQYVLNKLEKIHTSTSPLRMLTYGKMAHYCSDFCCSVHFDGKVGDVVRHMRYEKELNCYAKQNLSALVTLCEKDNHARTLHAVFHEYGSCAKYVYENDLKLAVNACTVICKMAVRNKKSKKMRRGTLIAKKCV